MGVVTVSSSASRTPNVGLSTKFPHNRSAKRPVIVAFKADKPERTALVAPQEPIVSPIVRRKEIKSRARKAKKAPRRVKATVTDEACTSAMEVDYNEAAAKLETIFRLCPATDSEVDEEDGLIGRRKPGKRRGETSVVRSRVTRAKRMSLEKRIRLKRSKEEESDELVVSAKKRKNGESEDDRIEKLVRGYSSSTDLASFDWKKMKIPPVLPSSEHTWLFKLMQPLKELHKVRESLQNAVEREPTESEIAEASNMSVAEVKRLFAAGRAARNKLIKHNLRLVLFVMNKYFENFANGPKFQDLCQAGVKGLITAIDRFEPKRKFRLSTYGLFWIRHAIVRSMTVSSFTRVSFGLESVRVEIQKAKFRLMFEHMRLPTEQEIVERVGISPERYREVMRASKPVISLHSKHVVTQEELINGITDFHGVGGDDVRTPALLRLALDDVLDSLKPKESLVIRQRYGLDGKGDRTLGEIAGNLNISREMVRKHEVKALMKLKLPARVDYLRRYLV